MKNRKEVREKLYILEGQVSSLIETDKFEKARELGIKIKVLDWVLGFSNEP